MHKQDYAPPRNLSGQSIGVASAHLARERLNKTKISKSKAKLAWLQAAGRLLTETALAAVGRPSDTDHEYSNRGGSASKKWRCSESDSTRAQ